MSYDNIPDELKALRQWVCWRYETRGGKQTKVPVNPRSRSAKPASTTDPTTWGTFVAAVKRAEMTGDGIVPVDGIGFVFTKDDPYIGIDIDGADGENLYSTRDIVAQFDSYAEWSPSNHGIHIIIKGDIPTDRSGQRSKGLEIYQHSRFFTMTGRLFDAAVYHDS